MKAVVLCGGKSTRMGTDKGLIKIDGVTQCEMAINKLQQLHIPVLISVNKEQIDSYSAIFPKYLLIQDNDDLDIGGPLKGILSVHSEYEDDDLIVLACDMPDMNVEFLEYLLLNCKQTNFEASVFKNYDQLEPLAAIYSSVGLKKIYRLFKNGELKNFSLHYVLDLLYTQYLPLPEKYNRYFKNFNTPDEY